MSQALDQELQHYMMLLNPSQKKSILAMMKTFLPATENSNRVSIKQYNNEIQEAEQRIESGQFVTQEELEKEAESW